MIQKFFSESVEQTQDIAKQFAFQLIPGDIVALIGGLGSGKTNFVKGICTGMNVIEIPLSPTFSLINEYHGDLIVYHFDFYRIKSIQELYDVGYEDYFFNKGICLIEWANLISNVLPDNYYEVTFSIGERENQREIQIKTIEK